MQISQRSAYFLEELLPTGVLELLPAGEFFANKIAYGKAGNLAERVLKNSSVREHGVTIAGHLHQADAALQEAGKLLKFKDGKPFIGEFKDMNTNTLAGAHPDVREFWNHIGEAKFHAGKAPAKHSHLPTLPNYEAGQLIGLDSGIKHVYQWGGEGAIEAAENMAAALENTSSQQYSHSFSERAAEARKALQPRQPG